jgi:hypothetical protein
VKWNNNFAPNGTSPRSKLIGALVSKKLLTKKMVEVVEEVLEAWETCKFSVHVSRRRP